MANYCMLLLADSVRFIIPLTPHQESRQESALRFSFPYLSFALETENPGVLTDYFRQILDNPQEKWYD